MREGNCVAIGWDKLGDLSDVEHDAGSKERIRQRIQDAYPSDPASVGRETQQVFNFVAKIDSGDYVVAMKGGTVLGTGKVAGSYEFDPTHVFPHRRPVEWLSLALKQASYGACVGG